MPDTYVVKFDRISRNHDVPALVVSGDADDIAEQIWRYARPKCVSRDIDVSVDLDKMQATIYAGWHVAGTAILEKDDA